MLISFENTVNNEFKIWITISTILSYVDKFQIMLKKQGGDMWRNFTSFVFNLTIDMHCTIWHNNKCSTSRKVLEHLNAKGYKVEIRDYLSQPPSAEELQKVLTKLGQNADYILRKKDKVFQEKFANKALSNEKWINAMHQNPSIIERPIVICKDRAWLARPFEKWVEEFTQ